jgi:hypothetical protein
MVDSMEDQPMRVAPNTLMPAIPRVQILSLMQAH